MGYTRVVLLNGTRHVVRHHVWQRRTSCDSDLACMEHAHVCQLPVPVRDTPIKRAVGWAQRPGKVRAIHKCVRYHGESTSLFTHAIYG